SGPGGVDVDIDGLGKRAGKGACWATEISMAAHVVVVRDFRVIAPAAGRHAERTAARRHPRYVASPVVVPGEIFGLVSLKIGNVRRGCSGTQSEAASHESGSHEPCTQSAESIRVHHNSY